MIQAIGRMQEWFERVCYGAGYTLDLLVRAAGALRYLGKRRKEVFELTYQATFGAFPVVLVIAFFIGMIVAIQTGDQLRALGQESFIGFIVSAGMVREMGPVFTALALAGLVGSTYAASIGTMKVSEEIDALEVMSIDPVYYLAMPRILALVIAAIVLTIYADLVGIIGGAIVSKTIFRVDLMTYYNNAREVLRLRDLWGGVLKSVVFAIAVGTIACSQGMRAGHGAKGVGDATMRSVVLSMIFILFFDYLISWFLL